MQTEATIEKTFTQPQEAFAYLEQTLARTLRDSPQSPRPEAIQLCCLDSTTQERHESAGDPERVSETVLAFLKEAGDHYAGAFITAGDHRLSIKVSPRSCRMTVTPLPFMPLNLPAPAKSATGAPGISGDSPPRPCGLSG